MDDSSFSKAISILGWIVAVLSLGLNWVIYSDSQKRREAKEKEIPTFSIELATFETKGLPQEILNLKDSIQHAFVISHRSGRSVEDLTIEFTSPGPEIVEVKVAEGKQGTNTIVEAGRLEASLKKDSLLPGQSIRGSVITKGIATLKTASAAGVGRKWTSADTVGTGNSPINREVLFVTLFIGVFAISIVLLAYKALPVLQASTTNAPEWDEGSRRAVLFVLVLITIIPDFNLLPGIRSIFGIVGAYLLITNYGDIVKAIKNLAAGGLSTTNKPSEPNQANHKDAAAS